MTGNIYIVSQDPVVRDFCRHLQEVYRLRFYSDWNKLYDSVIQCVPLFIFVDYSFFASNDPQLLEDFHKQFFRIPFYILTRSDCSYFLPYFQRIGIKRVIHIPCEKNKFKKIITEHHSTQICPADFQPCPIPHCPKLNQFLGNSHKMTKLKNTVYHYSQTDTPLLLTGESGTGKSYLARLIHDMSPRRAHPFCAINLTSIPISLAEAEFFGTTKGAYTDAISREGYFSSARFGTLFLDEIGDLPISIQPKLLHVLEEQSYNKVGSPKKIKCNTRFLFATNADLQHLVDQGLFRSDLFYRISILPIEVPPLRERKTDIPQLARHFLKPYKKDLSSSSIQKLMDYHWPGNVRELKNCLLRACIISTKEMIHDGCISF